MREAVDRLYQLILIDPELVPYFEGKDLPQLKGHMAALLAKVLGGPDGYGGRDLVAAHEGLGVTEDHYDTVANYLVNVLLNMGADDDVITAVSLTLASVRDQVVAMPDDRGVTATGDAVMPGEHLNALPPSVPEGV